MKKNERTIIFALIAIFIIILVVVLVVRGTGKKDEQQNNTAQTNTVEEEFVDKLPDGTKVNVSNKLKEAKQIEGLEVSNIRLVTKDNLTRVLADVKNSTNETKGGIVISLKILDKEGKTITTVPAVIDPIKPGETALIDSATTADFANAYDFTITKTGNLN